MRTYQREHVEIWSDLYYCTAEEMKALEEAAYEEMRDNGIKPDAVLSVGEEIRPGVHNAEVGYSKDKINEWAQEMNAFYLDVERDNLDQELPDDLLAFGTIGRWNGTSKGVIPLSSRNLADCLRFSMGGDYADFYVEGEDMILEESHHDGTNTCVFRMMNPALSEDEREQFIDLLESGKCADAMTMTLPVGDYVREVYGAW